MKCCRYDNMEKLGPEKVTQVSGIRPPSLSPPLIDGRDCLRYLCETDQEDAVALLKSLHQRKPLLIPRVLPPVVVQPATPVSAVAEPISPDQGIMAELRRTSTHSRGSTAQPSTSTTLVPKSYVQYVAASGQASGAILVDNGENTDLPQTSGQALEKALHDAAEMNEIALGTQSLKLDQTVPVVGFCGHQFFATEETETCIIDVMRFGNLQSRSTVNYRTRDWSARDGSEYEASAGQLIFDPGESVKEIPIRILSDDVWHTTLEFIIELLPLGCENCMIDVYLYTAKVKVIDDDCFPTNRFAKQIRAGEYHKIRGAGLVVEYFKLNFMDQVVRKGTIKMLMVDQIHNVYFVGRLFMNVYMVDNVLANKTETLIGGSQQASLAWLASCNVLVFGLLYFLDQRKHQWKVAGESRMMLQKSLLRKFLNYDDASRRMVDQGSLVMAMTRDSVNMVKEGYLNAMKLVRAITGIVGIIVFQVGCPPLFGRPYRVAIMFVPLLVFTILLVGFLAMRWRMTTRVFTDMNTSENDLVEYVNQTAGSYRIIADYNQRGKYVDMFEEIIETLNKRISAMNIVNGENLYFPQWVTTVFVSAYYIIGGTAVADPNDPNSEGTTLGTFLSDIAVFTQIGLAAGVIYQALLEIVTVFPPLERVTTLANLATDVKARGQISEWNRKTTRERRATLIGKGDDRRLPIDLLPIRVKDFEILGCNQSLTRKGLMEVRQGNLVALVGKRGQGKATLLKLLSGVLLPRMETAATDPGVFMPSHVRVLHLSLEPLFFKGTMYANLTFGVKSGHPDGNKSRVVAICRLMRIPEDTINLVLSDDIFPWDTYLSQTQKQALCLSRAFITNPEVLCIHKPTQVFDPDSALNVMKILRMFVTFKGVEMDNSSWHLRRTRTCMFTSTDRMNVVLADQVIHISKEGIKEIDKSLVCDTDLC